MSVRRREMLQILAGAAGGIVVVPGIAEGHPIQSHLTDHAKIDQAEAKAAAASGKPEFLAPHEFETLQLLADSIVPGASRAKAAEFIDQLLAVDTEENRRGFLNAIGAFEGRALESARRPWKALTGAEQQGILTEASTMSSGYPLEAPWTPGQPIARPHEDRPEPRMTLRDHFDLLKGWIAGAYYSSEIGMRELGWTGNVFHADFPGCQHPGGHP
jgi:hypothetical protein